MKRHIIIPIMTLMLFWMPVCIAWATYVGPMEIFSAPIEVAKSDDVGAVFALNYFVRNDGAYIEPDGTDINIYGPSGLLKKISVSQGPGFQSREHFSDQFIYVFGSIPDTSDSIYENIYIYNYDGNLIKTLKLAIPRSLLRGHLMC